MRDRWQLHAEGLVQGHVHGTGLKAGNYQAPIMHVGDVS